MIFLANGNNHGGLPNPNQTTPQMRANGNFQQQMQQSMKQGQQKVAGRVTTESVRNANGQGMTREQRLRQMQQSVQQKQLQQKQLQMQVNQKKQEGTLTQEEFQQLNLKYKQLQQQIQQQQQMIEQQMAQQQQMLGTDEFAMQEYNGNTALAESDSGEETPPKKKMGKGKKILIGVVAVVAVTFAGAFVYGKFFKKPATYVVTTEYEESGRYPLDNYVATVTKYNADDMREVVPNSWVALEWDYANDNPIRENWVNSVCSYVSFEYPQSQKKNNLGELVVDSNGERDMEDSPMTDGEAVTVTIVDYDALSSTMWEEVEVIADKYQKSGYKPEDYTYKDEMTDLMLNYLLEKSNLPTKTVEVVFPLEAGMETVENNDGSKKSVTRYTLTDDAELDKLLFSSDEFHNMCDTFGTIIMQYDNEELVGVNAPEPVEETPEGTESESAADTKADSNKDKADTKEAKKEDKAAKKEDKAEAKATNASANGDFKVELLRNETPLEIEFVANKEESKKEESKKEDKKAATDSNAATESKAATDDSSAEETDGTPVDEAEEQEQTYWVDSKGNAHDYFNEFGYYYESIITYTWCGAWYCANEYEGESNPEIQEGNGSYELPAGIGTTVVTKCLGTDNKYHDVKVTLRGYWLGQNAIDYAVSWSEKNRGFDNTSVVKLVCFEVQVENLETKPFTAISEMYLADSQSNASSRSGKMYGFYDQMEIQPHEKVIMNDWATSTEMEQKFVCWGKSFRRNYDTVWFKLLAGSGEEVPDYDANKTFINRDGSDDSSEAEDYEMNEVTTTTTTTTATPAAGEVVTE